MNVFARELLNHRLYEVCADSLPSRDDYSSWMRPLTSIISVFINDGEPSVINRQRCNEVLNNFMITLCFPDDDLPKLFSCTKCERVLESGTRKLEGALMDGTAAGILGQSPHFDRCKYLVSHPGRSVPEHQELISTPSSQETC